MTQSAIDPTITMHDLLAAFPGARRALFVKYHIGGCSSCGFRPDETLAEVCARNENLPVEDAIAHIQHSDEEDAKAQVTPTELAELRKDNAIKLLDIRTREEFEAARIEGAVLFTQELMQEITTQWDKTTRFVLIDHDGSRSMDAVAYFAGHGFAGVKALRGGIDAWSQEVDSNIPRYELE